MIWIRHAVLIMTNLGRSVCVTWVRVVRVESSLAGGCGLGIPNLRYLWRANVT